MGEKQCIRKLLLSARPVLIAMYVVIFIAGRDCFPNGVVFSGQLIETSISRLPIDRCLAHPL